VRPLPDLDALLGPVREAAREMPREAISSLVGAIAALQAEITLVAAESDRATTPGDNHDRALSPAEAARMLGRSCDWVYRNRRSLPVTRLPSGRWVVSESKLRRWMDARSRR
jgi:hypothetical protein